MILYFIRHGFPNYQNDTLTDEGKRQAEETAKKLNNVKFDYIFSSTFGRAIETAEHLANKQNKEIIKLPWAIEDNAAKYFAMYDEETKQNNWFFWIKKCIKEMLKTSEDKEWYNNPVFDKSNVKTGLNFYAKEIKEWLKTLGIYHDYETKTFHKVEGKDVPDNVAFFAHGGMAMAFLSNILDLNYSYFSTHFTCLETCGVVKILIDLENHVARLLNYNEVYYN